MILKAVIIDDEINSQEVLFEMVKRYCPEITVLGYAGNVESGINLVRSTQPDLLFLDVEMPGGSGFDILDAFHPLDFRVIFVTGYDQYAVRAIRYAALDYLLKPVDLQELQTAVKRAIQISHTPNESIQFLKSSLIQRPEKFEQIVLSDNRKHAVVPVRKILYLEAEGNYITFYLEGEQRQMVINSLNYYEELLSEESFFRIHKSHLVNLRKIISYETGRGGQLQLVNGTKLAIATRRKTLFIKRLQNIWPDKQFGQF
ncbi:MAG: LytTR family DNA-binding domain-containing protein [Bacteroidota bacterium]